MPKDRVKRGTQETELKRYKKECLEACRTGLSKKQRKNDSEAEIVELTEQARQAMKVRVFDRVEEARDKDLIQMLLGDDLLREYNELKTIERRNIFKNGNWD